ncbi:hypothetical protein SAMN05444008_10935 [Cnuella takakiae]|uniref:Uncharacterized protein n=1 Tax=Cnuella takakiae TaxID=1302690 RepID=A0A1M5CEF0_9BACT|nr:hypothetical protein [Cnuella takakiae]OLY91787.1 hypothetical protein BUE76_07660 [Cnuella takakiae]SHF53105.1 hypothetical protein SAMN05444008_10935 [Cnuella takakiae]
MKANNRKQKIETLRALIEGKKSITDLQPTKKYQWMCEDGMYTLWPGKPQQQSEPMSEEAFNRYCDENPGMHFIIK